MHTPIQKLTYHNQNGIRLYCKRDDLLPFSLGGNKVRIAHKYFEDMQRLGRDCMIVYGNSRSNLCRVLANLCCAKGIPCYMVCSSEETDDPGEVTNNSRIMNWLGARVIPCTKTNIAQTIEETFAMLTAEGKNPYYIFGNKSGTGNEGVPVGAYVEAYREIKEWQMQNQTHFSHIFFASGTGATQSGLISGKLLEHGQEEIIGISISSREYERAVGIIETAIGDYFTANSLELPADFQKEIHLKTAYRKGGYGLYDQEILDTVRHEFCQNGIPLDPTYTGKAFLGMKKYLEEHQIQDCSVLFLHTGGTPLFYDCLAGGTQ